jgi:hypothetical protein
MVARVTVQALDFWQRLTVRLDDVKHVGRAGVRHYRRSSEWSGRELEWFLAFLYEATQLVPGVKAPSGV